jgi:CO dehydrogenase/acetyl-CoA synthase beta subunit
MQELIQMEGFKILSPEIQKLIQEKWNILSLWAQNMIIENLKSYQIYQDTALKIAIESDKNFSKNLQDFIIKKRKQKLSEIEEQEKEEDLQNLVF